MKIYEYGNRDADTVLIQPVDDHDLEGIENEVEIITRSSNRSFYLLAVKIEDWNTDLSPWTAPAVFGKNGFGCGAEKTLISILELCTDSRRSYFIGGYSLAGLFALWAVYRSDVFRGAAAASPSVWFPGFTDFMRRENIRTGAVYLSLGDREEKVRNRIMAAVGDRIREAYDLLLEREIDCVLEWNEGNHFREPDVRTARAFAWLMNRHDQQVLG
ncbi:MAG: hypothetical protein II847_01935 [Ruminobacter sp.]|uniref:Esterase n=1 Tax=Ruminobacter amylophilus TaxID=867 RepID=A0A662ZHF5_9GAMM|nr:MULTISPECIES: esterase [Ruminobacter]MBQ3774874.1 hypothetical protein [Ruminobacter sp.]SFP40793.1 hypothetical protein SAMN02910344_01306 [Ruminobacter amylophilus]